MDYTAFRKHAAAVAFLEKLAEASEILEADKEQQQQEQSMPWETPVINNPQIGKPNFMQASRQRMTYYDPSKYTQ